MAGRYQPLRMLKEDAVGTLVDARRAIARGTSRELIDGAHLPAARAAPRLASGGGPRLAAAADPSVYAVVDIPMRSSLAYLERLREETGVPGHRDAPGRARLALAIRQFPQLNGIVARGRIMLRDTVDIFLQVATEGGRDLSGFKIVRADEKTRGRDRAARWRSGSSGCGSAATSRSSARSRCSIAIPLPILGPVMRTIAYLIYDLDLDLSRFGIVKDEFGSAMVSNVGTFGLTTAHGAAGAVQPHAARRPGRARSRSGRSSRRAASSSGPIDDARA